MKKESRQAAPEKQKKKNYYALLRNNLARLYPKMEDTEISILCREVVFAPQNYQTRINKTPVPITVIRENLADNMERSISAQEFIPYSLNAAIADLIEKNNCETSSVNEYYRWISLTAELVHNVSDGIITDEDIKLRQNFIDMSFDREAEILLCLALYQGADALKNNAKIKLLKFKLARLREMRSIVRNISNRATAKEQLPAKDLRPIYEHCLELLAQKVNFRPNVNLKLKININDNTEDEPEEDFSYFSYLQDIILQMMRKIEETYSVATRQKQDETLENQLHFEAVSRSSSRDYSKR